MYYRIKDFHYNLKTSILSCEGILIYDYTKVLKNTPRIIGRLSEAYKRDFLGSLRYKDNHSRSIFFRDVFLFYYIRDYMIVFNIDNIDELQEYFKERGFYEWFQKSIECCNFRKFPD